MEAEPQAAVTHRIREKAKGHTGLGSLFGEGQEGCLEEGPWQGLA